MVLARLQAPGSGVPTGTVAGLGEAGWLIANCPPSPTAATVAAARPVWLGTRNEVDGARILRAFIGIEVSDDVRAALTRVQDDFSGCGAKVKLVAPANVHLTMKFLGEIDDQMAGNVASAMAEAAGAGPITFEVAGLGQFPPHGKPRTLWAGVSDGVAAVVALSTRLDAALGPLGFESERQFVPHATIGRVKSPKGAGSLTPVIEHHAAVAFGTCRAEEMVLFKSTLTPQGAIYDVLTRKTL